MTAPDQPTAEVAVPAPLQTLAGTSMVSYEELMGKAAVVEGYALTDKDTLLGHPFIITGVTFRYARIGADKKPLDFVSVEAVDLNDAAIVFNDGSTGVRRQVVQYLQSEGLVKEDQDPDAPLCTKEGDTLVYTYKDGTLQPLRAPRGLRVSEYENEYGEARTFYLG